MLGDHRAKIACACLNRATILEMVFGSNLVCGCTSVGRENGYGEDIVRPLVEKRSDFSNLRIKRWKRRLNSQYV